MSFSFRRGASFCAAPCWDSPQRKARRVFSRGAAPFQSPPSPDGTGGMAREGNVSGATLLFSPTGGVFSAPAPPTPQQHRRRGGGDGDGGARPLGPGGLQGRGAWPCAPFLSGARPLSSAQAPPRMRALPEPDPSSGSVVAVVAGQPAGSARIARDIARPAGCAVNCRGRLALVEAQCLV